MILAENNLDLFRSSNSNLMSGVPTIGSVVRITDDVYEDNRYEVLEIKDDRARLQRLSPAKQIFWIASDELECCPETKVEVVAEWQRVHGSSGM
jgi:hypothetical protein